MVQLNRGIALVSLWLLAGPLAVNAADNCQLGRLAVLPVTMNGLRPTVEAQINGSPALFTLDSGAFWSMLSPAAAAHYQLRVDYDRVHGLWVDGVGGRVAAALTTVKTFTVFNYPFRNVDFIVGGSDPGKGTVGLLGQNLLRFADVEYDLAHGTLSLFKPDKCKHAVLAYWVKPGESYSSMDIEDTTPLQPHTTGHINLNGTKVRVQFDTGASTTIVGLRMAAAAGLKPGDPGVKPNGYNTGIGRKPVQTWVGTFPLLTIGGEEIHNARLSFGDLGPFDMLLGDDFFLSHRVYVANSQHKLYFTYNGGPVFALDAARKSAATPAADTEQLAAENVADIARRAAASAARRDFEPALQDFNRACELAPDNADYHYQRALVEFALKQSEAAVKDLDRTLTLEPGHVDAAFTRARYRLARQDTSGALADLDAADKAAAKEADIRLGLGALYERLGRYDQAIAQLNLWLPLHEQDPRAPEAYNDRCWTRAALGRELDQALRDCNAGLRLNSHAAALFDSSGLVYLRLNKLDKAIHDYNDALKISPKIAASLYGRGVAEVRKGMTAKGEADMAAAKEIAPHVADRARSMGLTP